MSIHRSFKTAGTTKRHRNVLKRLERIKKLSSEDKWTEDENSIFGLPKVRSIKIKTSKGKAKSASDKDDKK